jgi:hypothetical protein
MLSSNGDGRTDGRTDGRNGPATATGQRRPLLHRLRASVRRSVGPSVIVLLAGCEIEDITIPLGREVIVVQAVMSLDSAALAQYVVVERSVTGTITIPDQDSLRGPPRPPLPVSGARVVVTRDDGDSLLFGEIADTAGVYKVSWTEALPFLQPGRVYQLRVDVPGGRVVRGRMRMPYPLVVAGLPPDGATFNRDRDTLFVQWGGGQYSKGVYIQVRPRDVSRWVRLVMFTDSSRFVIPGRMVYPLPNDTLPPDVWIAGTRQTFTVAAMDTTFFGFFRSANDPFTGSGFINTIEGGLGVFGGIAPVNRTYDVVGDIDHPWEGAYTLTTSFPGETVTHDITLYVTRDVPRPVLVSALASNTSGTLAPRFEATGAVTADSVLSLTVVPDQPGPAVQQRRALLRGTFRPEGTTSGPILNPATGEQVGTFTMVRAPAPLLF